MKQNPGQTSSLSLIAFSITFSLLVSAFAFEIKLDPPGEREFISDHAGMLDPLAQSTIKSISGSLLTEKATPIMVVTIESMAKYGGEGLRIETFANLLFDQWQIGNQNLGADYWNTGILLLVSKNDRKARIELGAGWGRNEDALCRQIMDQYIIPQFKRGDFSAGIVAGVKALDKMGRKLELPGHVKVVSSKAAVEDRSERLAAKQRMGEAHHAHGSVFERPWRQLAVGGVFLGIVVFTIVSLVRKGASGWAWLAWGVVFTFAGVILASMVSGKNNGSDDDGFFGGGNRFGGGGGFGGGFGGGSSGGGFSGGSSGGGFSGGGGASGSW